MFDRVAQSRSPPKLISSSVHGHFCVGVSDDFTLKFQDEPPPIDISTEDEARHGSIEISQQ